MTAVVHQLRRELDQTRIDYGRRSSKTQAAFERLVRGAARTGEPIDGLRINSLDESERFFARTVPGPEGHVYWTRGRDFNRNDGRKIVPRRWWWKHVHGEIDNYIDVVAMCGDRACINPEHCQSGRHLSRIRFSETAMIGALQVGALRLGHTPNQNEWEGLGLSPTANIYLSRFGTWLAATQAAGLSEPPRWTFTSEECLDALLVVHAKIGGWPSERQYQEAAGDGMPHQMTVSRHFGGWLAARKVAQQSLSQENDRRPRHPSQGTPRTPDKENAT